VDTVSRTTPAAEVTALPALAAAIPRRERITPSSLKGEEYRTASDSAGGMLFGTEVHAVFEAVGWVDESTPQLPPGPAGRLVADLLRLPDIRSLFERNGRTIELFREQAVDAILDDRWLSGVIDRLHLHRDSSGRVDQVVVIDFKTDACAEIGELAGKYAGQMEAYRRVMRLAYPEADIRCTLLSSACRAWVEV
jgi:ATP-dependent exoDNAse (exonuclease V) beta subunit